MRESIFKDPRLESDQRNQTTISNSHYASRNTSTNFCPSKLLVFDKKDNIYTFIKLFNMSMKGANDEQRASTIMCCLSLVEINLIMPSLPENFTYDKVKAALIKEFGSRKSLAMRKTKFMQIKFKKDENITDFADHYYYKAYFLQGAGEITEFNALIIIKQLVVPYKK